MEKEFYMQTGIEFKDYLLLNKFKHRNIVNKFYLREETDDVLQDYYINILKIIARGVFDINKSAFSTFDFLCLNNFCKRKYVIENKVILSSFNELIDVIDTEYDFSIENRLEEIYYILNTKISELNKKIFIERYIELKSGIEIAELNGITLQQVKNRLFLTLKKIKKYIK